MFAKKGRSKYKNSKKSQTVLLSWERCVRAVRTLCARRERAVNTIQQQLARHRSAMDAIKTPWERRVDAVGTLWGRCIHAIAGSVDILGVFRGNPTARW